MTLLGAEDNSLVSVLPVGMQNSALVLDDEDDNSISQELENLSSSEQSITPAAINIENSSDVIIGPVTRFNGPVTIYQNVNGSPSIPHENGATRRINGRLVKSESTSSDTSHPTEKSSKNLLFGSKHLTYISLSIFLLAVIVIVATVTILSLKSEENSPPPPNRGPPNHSQPSDGNDALKPAGPGAIIEKKDWGGEPALKGTVPLQHPVHLVIISHSATPQCEDFFTCSERMKSIQNYQVSAIKMLDIGYNFMIGKDGRAYVGRGWDTQNGQSKDSIGICFVGNYVYNYLTPDMIKVAKKLLKIGVNTGKLSEDYKLVAHNQTYNTISPGPHVYEVIKTWPHFDPQKYV